MCMHFKFKSLKSLASVKQQHTDTTQLVRVGLKQKILIVSNGSCVCASNLNPKKAVQAWSNNFYANGKFSPLHRHDPIS